ncbi:membrane protein [Gemmatimonadetes bacterium T265]|nr:membrane protein [Gemmatimonadetes bacterium T265]
MGEVAAVFVIIPPVEHAPEPGAPWVVALVFGLAGALHFVRPRLYESVMPPWVPPTGPLGRRALVLASGACEILGALGVLYAPTRTAAGWGLVLLLAAVFPANVEMLAAARRSRAKAWVQALFVARLPLQPVIMWWVWTAAVRSAAPRG